MTQNIFGNYHTDTSSYSIVNFYIKQNLYKNLQALARRRITGWQLAPFQLLESTIRPKLSIIDEELNCNRGQIQLSPEDEPFINPNDALVRYLAFVFLMCDINAIISKLNTQLSLFYMACKSISKYMFQLTDVLFATCCQQQCKLWDIFLKY